MNNMFEEIVGYKRIFDGRLLKLDIIDVKLSDGILAQREVVVHPGAVAVLLYESKADKFIFVKQYRLPAKEVLLEVVAGTLKGDESAEECAVREVAEETGFNVKNIVKLGEFFASPGYSKEKIIAYYGEVSDKLKNQLCDPDERISVVKLSLEEIKELLISGGIQDAKTISCLALYFLEKNFRKNCSKC